MREDDEDPPGPAFLKVLSVGEAASEEEKKDRAGKKGVGGCRHSVGDCAEQQGPRGTYFKDPDGEGPPRRPQAEDRPCGAHGRASHGWNHQRTALRWGPDKRLAWLECWAGVGGRGSEARRTRQDPAGWEPGLRAGRGQRPLGVKEGLAHPDVCVPRSSGRCVG